MKAYCIKKYYERADRPARIIQRGYTLEQARKYCSDPETSSKTAQPPLGCGGDYHEDNPDYNFVGYWCWDEISVEDASTFDKTGYGFLALDFCERGLKRSETYERANNDF